MGSPSIPSNYTLTLHGGVDMGLDDIQINNLPLIKLDTESKVDAKFDGRVNAGLDDIRIKQLPKIELELSIKPTRVHVPTHYEMCFSLLGMEMFKLGVCGETMVVTEPYVPHQTESCA